MGETISAFGKCSTVHLTRRVECGEEEKQNKGKTKRSSEELEGEKKAICAQQGTKAVHERIPERQASTRRHTNTHGAALTGRFRDNFFFFQRERERKGVRERECLGDRYSYRIRVR